MKIKIINPDNGKPVSVKDWRKDTNPKRAQVLAIETNDGHLLLMSKNYLPGEYNYIQAQKACADFTAPGVGDIAFRCPTRRECLDIHDAYNAYSGLDEAIRLIGGNYDAKKDVLQSWFWTSERNKPTYSHYAYAWRFGNYGYLDENYIGHSNLALPVALL